MLSVHLMLKCNEVIIFNLMNDYFVLIVLWL